MEYTYFGNTGMKVSRICLGCMSFGSSEWRDWVLDEDESIKIIERALELGITFFDTANVYSQGESERILGKTLQDVQKDVVVATKVFFRMREDQPLSGGLSRKAIEQEVDSSLERLQTDSIDLYQIHRWDRHTPIETTLRTLTDVVNRGKVRSIGASSMWSYQLAEALQASERHNLESFVSMQNHYNLVYREEEREMLPYCQRKGLAVMPWSPLARGYLARPHDEVGSTRRGETEDRLYEHPYREGGGPEINRRVDELADEHGATMAQISLAWLLHKDWVDAPIVGTTSVHHLEQAVEALDIELSSDEMNYLEEPYQPVRVSGHQ